MYLSGWLRKLGVSLEDAEEFINELAKDDEEKGNRIRTLNETYKKQDVDEIAGYSGLLKLLTYDCSEDDAKEKLKKLKRLLIKYLRLVKITKKKKKMRKMKKKLILYH